MQGNGSGGVIGLLAGAALIEKRGSPGFRIVSKIPAGLLCCHLETLRNADTIRSFGISMYAFLRRIFWLSSLIGVLTGSAVWLVGTNLLLLLSTTIKGIANRPDHEAETPSCKFLSGETQGPHTDSNNRWDSWIGPAMVYWSLGWCFSVLGSVGLRTPVSIDRRCYAHARGLDSRETLLSTMY